MVAATAGEQKGSFFLLSSLAQLLPEVAIEV
jgi:hypothetical protein